MRARLALGGAALAAAALLSPAPAQAVCITAYRAVLGQCSPCDTANDLFRDLNVPATTACFA